MQIKDPAKTWFVVTTVGILVDAQDTEKGASDSARAMAERRCGEAYLVCRPIKMFRQKPVNVEEAKLR